MSLEEVENPQPLETSTRYTFFPNRSWSNPVGDLHSLPVTLNWASLHLSEQDYDSDGELTQKGLERLTCDQSTQAKAEPSIEITFALRSLEGPDFNFIHQNKEGEFNTAVGVMNVVKLFAPRVQTRIGQAFPVFTSTFDLEGRIANVMGATVLSDGNTPRVKIRIPLREFDLRPDAKNALWLAIDQGNNTPSIVYRPDAFSHCSVQAVFQPVGVAGDLLSHFLAGSCLGIHRPWEYASELSPIEDSPFVSAVCPFINRGMADWKMTTPGCTDPILGPFLVNAFGLRVENLEAELVDTCPSEPDAKQIVNLRVDTNRDGQLTEDDETGEDVWRNFRGALYLPNIDSDFGPHSSLHKSDASDEIINKNNDLDDLARMELEAVATHLDGLPRKARVTVCFENENVRLFVKTKQGTYRVWKSDRDYLEGEALTRRTEFRVEGITLAIDQVPTVEFVAHLTAEDAEGHPLESSDRVKLRMAPLIFHSHLDEPEQLLISASNTAESLAFRQGMKEAAMEKGIELVEYKFSLSQGEGVSRWIQDRFEAGYVSMPGPSGKQQTIRVFVFNDSEQMPQENEWLAQMNLGPNVAALVVGDRKTDRFDLAGNFEVVPPLRGFPLGRVLRGSRNKADRVMTELVDSQRLQLDLLDDVPVDWLLVGHIDEIVTFIPARNARGWAVLVADPALAINLLKDELQRGNGSARLFSVMETAPEKHWKPMTIAEYLSEYENTNMEASQQIENTVKSLVKQLGLYEGLDLIRVPVLFYERYGKLYTAHTANLVNGVFLNSDLYLAGKPYGPEVNGKDVFETYFEQTMSEHGIRVKWIDAFKEYHLNEGGLHCGSNVIRKIPNKPWWTKYE